MSERGPLSHYGVRIANTARDSLDVAVETLGLLGYAVVDSGIDAAQLDTLRSHFDALHAAEQVSSNGDHLRPLGEAGVIRCPLAFDPLFLNLASTPHILSLCERLMGSGFILNQQNGIVNPAGAKTYSQSAYHRDLPYQHFVSSRPLAINALFCLDPFTLENGATYVIPASHKQEAFPSDQVITAHSKQITAPAGSFLVLDCMVYHCGGTNFSTHDRRAVNHVYTIAMIRQQIDLPAYLGHNFSSDPKIRQLLNFNHPTARSVEEFVSHRKSNS